MREKHCAASLATVLASRTLTPLQRQLDLLTIENRDLRRQLAERDLRIAGLVDRLKWLKGRCAGLAESLVIERGMQ